METVFLLWHVHHVEGGEDDEKLLGVFSSEAKAKSAIEQLKSKPGFKDYPDDFEICDYSIDRVEWSEGFVKW